MGRSASGLRPARLGAALLAALLLGGACSGTGGAPASSPRAGAARTGHPVATTSPVPTLPPRPWRVVALGDSVTTGGPCGCTPFPALYARDLAQARGVRATAVNLGQNGLDSVGLLHDLRDPRWPGLAAVRGADVLLLTIGANDFTDRHADVTSGRCLGPAGTDCVRDELAVMRRDVGQIVATVHRLRHGLPTAVLVTGYWNVFEDGDVARESFPDVGVRASRELTRLADAGIRQAARAAGATYVDLYAPFNGPASRGDTTALLGPDGDHPNARGQALIAQRLLAAGVPGLVEG